MSDQTPQTILDYGPGPSTAPYVSDTAITVNDTIVTEGVETMTVERANFNRKLISTALVADNPDAIISREGWPKKKFRVPVTSFNLLGESTLNALELHDEKLVLAEVGEFLAHLEGQAKGLKNALAKIEACPGSAHMQEVQSTIRFIADTADEIDESMKKSLAIVKKIKTIAKKIDESAEEKCLDSDWYM